MKDKKVKSKTKNTSNKSWVHRHLKDGFVKKSQQDGFFSRAAYKLLEINEKAKLFKPNMIVLDLGAAPGSWSQVASNYIKPKGIIFALDLLELKDISKINNMLKEELNLIDSGSKFDIVMSDMAPSLTGISSVDGARMSELLLSSLEIVKNFLNQNGSFVVKLFQGADFNNQIKNIKLCFESVNILKPKASRGESKEVYILAKRLKTIL